MFDSGDKVTAVTSGQYDDAIVGNSTSTTGDGNGDGEFDSGDLVAAFTQRGSETGPRTAVSAVPEPSGAFLLAVEMFGFGRRKPR